MNLYDPAAERAVLSGIFQYGNDIFIDVIDLLEVNSFSPENQIVFSCLQETLENQNNDEYVKQIDDSSFLVAASKMGLHEHFTNVS